MFAALSDYLDEQLPADACDRIREHMSDCRPCVAFLENLRETVNGLQQMPGAKPDPRVAAAIREKLLPELEAVMGARRSPAAKAGPF
jgi:Putative zinc-finger